MLYLQFYSLEKISRPDSNKIKRIMTEWTTSTTNDNKLFFHGAFQN